MSEVAVRLRGDAHAMIGEAPVVDADGAVTWTDPFRPALLTHARGAREVRVMPTPRPIWSLASLPAGGLAGTLDDAFCEIDPATGVVSAGPPADPGQGCRFNDMAVDSAGGLWAGAMHRGVLSGRGSILLAPSLDAAPRQVADGLGVPNGMAFSADGASLFVVDTLARTLLSFPVQPASGGLGEPVIVSDFMGLPGKPDGMALREDGAFWVAMWGGGCVVEILPDGATGRTVPIPAPHVSALRFAGPATLVVTTSRARLSDAQLAAHPGSGGLFEVGLGDR